MFPLATNILAGGVWNHPHSPIHTHTPEVLDKEVALCAVATYTNVRTPGIYKGSIYRVGSTGIFHSQSVFPPIFSKFTQQQ